MGLTARDFGDTRRLARLAENPEGTNREDIYLAVASLYRSQGEALSERERLLMHEILQRLTRDVEMAVRIALAERIADDPEAPLDLILLLCDDRIEVARPIILRNPRLTDRELLKFIAEADEARHIACAERPHISEPVSEALAATGSETVLVTLVRNATAHIGVATFERLVEKSRAIVALHDPLAHREDLPATLAARMCGWVSDALKTHLAESGRLTPETAAALNAATQAIEHGSTFNSSDAEANAQKLVDKLAAAGQLRAGFLLRVLQQRQMDMFDIAFAKLLEMRADEFRTMFYAGGPRSVALACRAVGIDKSVFATVFELSRASKGARALLTPDQRTDVEFAFSGFSKSEAKARLHTRAAA